MSMISKILVPVDFSSTTPKLLEYAAQFARKFDAEITVINIIENPLAYEGFFVNRIEKELRQMVERKMASFIEENAEEFGECKGIVINGDAVDEITELAAKGDFDMIIIGTHGYKGLEKILMGSVAERVLRTSPCPVLVYNPHKPRKQTAD